MVLSTALPPTILPASYGNIAEWRTPLTIVIKKWKKWRMGCSKWEFCWVAWWVSKIDAVVWIQMVLWLTCCCYRDSKQSLLLIGELEWGMKGFPHFTVRNKRNCVGNNWRRGKGDNWLPVGQLLNESSWHSTCVARFWRQYTLYGMDPSNVQ